MPAEVESRLGQHEPTQEKERTGWACEQMLTQRLPSETSSQPRDATDEEIAILPHVADRLPLAAWIVIFAGAAERFAYYAVIAPWQNYMQNPRRHHAVPGALGLGQSTATNIYNAFFFFSFLTPMPFALISDVWLGRYKTLMISLALYVCGCVLMLTTSLPMALEHGAGIPGLAASMILIGLGVGGVKATFSPFLGDQYIQKKPKLMQRKNGDTVILDSTLTLQLIYNVFYWFTNIASLSSIPSTFLERKYDFWAAYLLAAASLGVSVVLFVLWTAKLVRIFPQGNILSQATKTILCAVQSGFKLENAKSSYQSAYYGRAVPWSDHFVDEMKRGLIACRIIVSFVIFYLCIGQMYNNLISQAGQMNLHGIPNDMIQAMAGVACVLFGPAIQALYYFLAKRRLPFGPIARITVAFFFCGGGMAYAAGIQKLIYATGPCYDRPLSCAASNNGKLPNDVNVWMQMPIYFILAVAEIFGFVTASEYAYSKAPRDMRTIVQALTQLTACLGSALGMAISPVAKDPHLMIMYACLAGTMALCAALFWWRFRKYDRIDAELNRLDVQETSSSDRNDAGM